MRVVPPNWESSHWQRISVRHTSARNKQQQTRNKQQQATIIDQWKKDTVQCQTLIQNELSAHTDVLNSELTRALSHPVSAQRRSQRLKETVQLISSLRQKVSQQLDREDFNEIATLLPTINHHYFLLQATQGQLRRNDQQISENLTIVYAILQTRAESTHTSDPNRQKILESCKWALNQSCGHHKLNAQHSIGEWKKERTLATIDGKTAKAFEGKTKQLEEQISQLRKEVLEQKEKHQAQQAAEEEHAKALAEAKQQHQAEHKATLEKATQEKIRLMNKLYGNRLHNQVFQAWSRSALQSKHQQTLESQRQAIGNLAINKLNMQKTSKAFKEWATQVQINTQKREAATALQRLQTQLTAAKTTVGVEDGNGDVDVAQAIQTLKEEHHAALDKLQKLLAAATEAVRGEDGDVEVAGNVAEAIEKLKAQLAAAVAQLAAAATAVGVEDGNGNVDVASVIETLKTEHQAAAEALQAKLDAARQETAALQQSHAAELDSFRAELAKQQAAAKIQTQFRSMQQRRNANAKIEKLLQQRLKTKKLSESLNTWKQSVQASQKYNSTLEIAELEAQHAAALKKLQEQHAADSAAALKEATEALEAEHAATLAKAAEEHATTLAAAEAELERTQAEQQAAAKQSTALQSELQSKHEATLAALQSELQSKHQAALDKLKEQHAADSAAALKEATEALEAEHAATLAKAAEEHATELAEAKQQHQAALVAAEQQHAAAAAQRVEELQTQHKEAIATAAAQHEEALEKATAALQEQHTAAARIQTQFRSRKHKRNTKAILTTAEAKLKKAQAALERAETEALVAADRQHAASKIQTQFRLKQQQDAVRGLARAATAKLERAQAALAAAEAELERTQAEQQAAAKQSTALQSELAEQQAALAAAAAAAAQRVEELQAQHKEALAALKEQHAAALAKLKEQLHAQHSEQQAALERAEAALVAAEQKHQATLAAAEAELERTQAEQQAAAKQSTALQSELQSKHEATLAALQSELQSKHQAALDKLQEQLHAQHSEQQAALERAEAALVAAEQKHQAALAAAEAELERTQAEQQAAAEKSTALQSELAEQQAASKIQTQFRSMQQRKNANEISTAAEAKLTTSLAEAEQKHQAALAAATAEFEKKQTEHAAAHKEALAALQQSHAAKLTEQQAALAAAEAELERTQAEQQAAAEKSTALQSELAEQQAAHDEQFASLRAEHQAKLEDSAAALAAAAAAQLERTQAEQQAASKIQTQFRLNQQQDAVRGLARAATAKIERAQAALVAAEQQHQAALVKLREEHQIELDKQKEALIRLCTEFETKQQTLQAQNDLLTQKSSSIRAQLVQAAAILKQDDDGFASADEDEVTEDSEARSTTALTTITSELERLREKEAEYNSEKDRLSILRQQHAQALEGLTQQLTAQQKTNSQTTESNQKLSQQIDSITQTLEQTQAELAALKTRQETLTEDVKAEALQEQLTMKESQSRENALIESQRSLLAERESEFNRKKHEFESNLNHAQQILEKLARSTPLQEIQLDLHPFVELSRLFQEKETLDTVLTTETLEKIQSTVAKTPEVISTITSFDDVVNYTWGTIISLQALKESANTLFTESREAVQPKIDAAIKHVGDTGMKQIKSSLETQNLREYQETNQLAEQVDHSFTMIETCRGQLNTLLESDRIETIGESGFWEVLQEIEVRNAEWEGKKIRTTQSLAARKQKLIEMETIASSLDSLNINTAALSDAIQFQRAKIEKIETQIESTDKQLNILTALASFSRKSFESKTTLKTALIRSDTILKAITEQFPITPTATIEETLQTCIAQWPKDLNDGFSENSKELHILLTLESRLKAIPTPDDLVSAKLSELAERIKETRTKILEENVENCRQLVALAQNVRTQLGEDDQDFLRSNVLQECYAISASTNALLKKYAHRTVAEATTAKYSFQTLETAFKAGLCYQLIEQDDQDVTEKQKKLMDNVSTNLSPQQSVTLHDLLEGPHDDKQTQKTHMNTLLELIHSSFNTKDPLETLSLLENLCGLWTLELETCSEDSALKQCSLKYTLHILLSIKFKIEKSKFLFEEQIKANKVNRFATRLFPQDKVPPFIELFELTANQMEQRRYDYETTLKRFQQCINQDGQILYRVQATSMGKIKKAPSCYTVPIYGGTGSGKTHMMRKYAEFYSDQRAENPLAFGPLEGTLFKKATFWEYLKGMDALSKTLASQDPCPYPLICFDERKMIHSVSNIEKELLYQTVLSNLGEITREDQEKLHKSIFNAGPYRPEITTDLISAIGSITQTPTPLPPVIFLSATKSLTEQIQSFHLYPATGSSRSTLQTAHQKANKALENLQKVADYDTDEFDKKKKAFNVATDEYIRSLRATRGIDWGDTSEGSPAHFEEEFRLLISNLARLDNIEDSLPEPDTKLKSEESLHEELCSSSPPQIRQITNSSALSTEFIERLKANQRTVVTIDFKAEHTFTVYSTDGERHFSSNTEVEDYLKELKRNGILRCDRDKTETCQLDIFYIDGESSTGFDLGVFTDTIMALLYIAVNPTGQIDPEAILQWDGRRRNKDAKNPPEIFTKSPAEKSGTLTAHLAKVEECYSFVLSGEHEELEQPPAECLLAAEIAGHLQQRTPLSYPTWEKLMEDTDPSKQSSDICKALKLMQCHIDRGGFKGAFSKLSEAKTEVTTGGAVPPAEPFTCKVFKTQLHNGIVTDTDFLYQFLPAQLKKLESEAKTGFISAMVLPTTRDTLGQESATTTAMKAFTDQLQHCAQNSHYDRNVLTQLMTTLQPIIGPITDKGPIERSLDNFLRQLCHPNHFDLDETNRQFIEFTTSLTNGFEELRSASQESEELRQVGEALKRTAKYRTDEQKRKQEYQSLEQLVYKLNEFKPISGRLIKKHLEAFCSAQGLSTSDACIAKLEVFIQIFHACKTSTNSDESELNEILSRFQRQHPHLTQTLDHPDTKELLRGIHKIATYSRYPLDNLGADLAQISITSADTHAQEDAVQQLSNHFATISNKIDAELPRKIQATKEQIRRETARLLQCVAEEDQDVHLNAIMAKLCHQKDVYLEADLESEKAKIQTDLKHIRSAQRGQARAGSMEIIAKARAAQSARRANRTTPTSETAVASDLREYVGKQIKIDNPHGLAIIGKPPHRDTLYNLATGQEISHPIVTTDPMDTNTPPLKDILIKSPRVLQMVASLPYKQLTAGQVIYIEVKTEKGNYWIKGTKGTLEGKTISVIEDMRF